jgi:hypothetical protein
MVLMGVLYGMKKNTLRGAHVRPSVAVSAAEPWISGEIGYRNVLQEVAEQARVL